MTNKILSRMSYVVFSGCIALAVSPVFAAGGLTKTKSWLSSFQTEIHGLAAVVFVLAGLFAAYKMMWRGQPFESISNVIYGAITIIAVPEIALAIWG